MNLGVIVEIWWVDRIAFDAGLFGSGYLVYDLTGDGLTESADYSLVENNLGKILSHP